MILKINKKKTIRTIMIVLFAIVLAIASIIVYFRYKVVVSFEKGYNQAIEDMAVKYAFNECIVANFGETTKVVKTPESKILINSENEIIENAMKSIYPMTAIITEINYEKNEVTITNCNGFDFKFVGCEDYEVNDLVSVIMNDNGTINIEDDYIVNQRYDGSIESFINIKNTEMIQDFEMKSEIAESKETHNYHTPFSIDDFGSFKSYMSYKALTSKSSIQYKIQQSAWTDEEGLRRYDDYYMVATGSAYGSVGDILRVKLTNGTVFTAVKGDMKADKDTDEQNKICIHDKSVIEFIVDTQTLNKTAKKLGNVSCLGFEGPIESIEVVGTIL